jgi:hypothetical protein
MKKLSVIFICLLINLTFAFAQNLQIYRNGNLLANHEVINLAATSYEIIEVHLNVKNIAASTLNVKVKKIETSLISGSDNSFCFAGQCYPPSTTVSSSTASIASNSFDTTFKADYSGNGVVGTTTVAYVFYDISKPSDSVSVIMNFTTTVGVKEIIKSEASISEAFPNPASNLLSFYYNLPKQTSLAKISIFNIIGENLATIDLNESNGKKSINIADFKEGIYFYTLTADNIVVTTRKFMIKH